MTDAVANPEAAPIPEAPPKADPETLVLRGRPRRVVRFRRGAIIAIAAASSSAIAGVAWMALQPTTFRGLAGTDEKDIANRAPHDALAGAPTSYGEVPRLGPPLPGDLGRPILRRQEQLGLPPPGTVADPAFEAAEAERQRAVAEQKAARESGVMLQLGGAGTNAVSAAVSVGPNAEVAPPPAAERVTPDPERDPNGQQRKNALVGRANTDGDINPHRLTVPVSPWTLHAGSVIAASLITGLNSDLPGLVTAQVTENIYDSATGRIQLVPQGARLLGRYDSVVAFGQSRALVVWQRLIMPDGSSLRLDNLPATDPSGYAGLEDKVNFHTWRLLKGVAIATLLGVGSEFGLTGESDLVEAIRESAQSNTARAGDRLTQRNLDIQPTITIRPGAPVRLVVHRDLVLAPWSGVGVP